MIPTKRPFIASKIVPTASVETPFRVFASEEMMEANWPDALSLLSNHPTCFQRREVYSFCLMFLVIDSPRIPNISLANKGKKKAPTEIPIMM